jgi:threonine aldolase
MTGSHPIDLRSDTVTRPAPGMRQAMAEAEVGDDVYGDDPTVNRLEAEVARLLGYPAGLFTPSGSMANQLGLRLLVKPGQELVCDSSAHVVRSELGAAAAFSGITTRTWPTERGLLDPDVVAGVIAPNMPWHQVSTAAIAVENTHNFGGGTVQPQAAVRAVIALGRQHRLGLHLDGARLWNAHVATGLELAELADGFDTVSVCLSKGLGAPVGSVLVSSTERIAEARIWRKRYGGGMRQAGILAAACHYALDHHLERLAEDHEHARLLAERLGGDPATVQTNMVVLDDVDADRVIPAAQAQGVLVGHVSSRRIRLVTHLDVDRDGVERAAKVLGELIAG